MKFTGKIVNGIVLYYNPGQRLAFIKSMEGKEVEESIEKLKIKKTLPQLKGIHVLLTKFTTALNELTGNDLSVEDVKGIIKVKRNLVEDIYDVNSGQYIGQKLRSFASLELQEMSELIEWVYAWSATEWNITLPPLEQIEQ